MSQQPDRGTEFETGANKASVGAVTMKTSAGGQTGVGDKTRFELVGHTTLGAPDGGFTNIAVSEERGLAALGSFVLSNTDVHIADISEASAPRHVASISAGSGYVNDVCWHPTEPWLLTANESGGVGIVDLTVPATPTLRCEYTLAAGHPHTITTVDEQYAIVSGTERGMVVLDITDPDAVEEVTQFRVGDGAVFDTRVRDNYAFLAHGDRGLYVLDITDPTAPTVATAFDYQNEQAAVPLGAAHSAVPHPTDEYCLVSDRVPTDRGCRHVIEFDVDRGETTLLSSFPSPRGPPSRQLEGETVRWTGQFAAWGTGDQQDVLFSGEYRDGVQAFDCSDPAEPTRIGQYYPSEGVGEVRCANPARVVDEYPLVWSATTDDSEYVYVSDFQTGLYVFSLEGY